MAASAIAFGTMSIADGSRTTPSTTHTPPCSASDATIPTRSHDCTGEGLTMATAREFRPHHAECGVAFTAACFTAGSASRMSHPPGTYTALSRSHTKITLSHDDIRPLHSTANASREAVGPDVPVRGGLGAGTHDRTHMTAAPAHIASKTMNAAVVTCAEASCCWATTSNDARSKRANSASAAPRPSARATGAVSHVAPVRREPAGSTRASWLPKILL